MVDVLENAANEAQRFIAWPWKQSSKKVHQCANECEGLKDHRCGDQTSHTQRVTMHDISEHHHERLKKRKKDKHKDKSDENGSNQIQWSKSPKISSLHRPAIPPGRQVKFLLGPDHVGSGHEPHPIFCEMEELVSSTSGVKEWKETARWVKFEEDVEDGGNRWSKPHVATLSLHSLFELRNLLTKGVIILDMDAQCLDDIADLLLDQCVNNNIITNDKRKPIKDAIMRKKTHQFEAGNGGISRKDSLMKSIVDHNFLPTSSSKSLFGLTSSYHGSFPDAENGDSTPDLTSKSNHHFMKKLPKDAEASNILIGEMDELTSPLSVFIRLNKSILLGDLTEVPLPTRFIFILLGPPGMEDYVPNSHKYHEIGRSMATCFTDVVFQELAYKCSSSKHLVAGIDEFLDSVTVIPPGEWDPSIRIEPPQFVASQDGRKNSDHPPEILNEDEIREKSRVESGLVKSGRLFGGLIADIKRKAPHYKSDFVDGFSLQCLASVLFMYFAILAPVVTFGGLLGEATDNHISVIEALIGGMVVGVAYGFWSGQPLSILGPTGPTLVFETIVYDMCKTYEWDYLSFRLCIGIWVGLILIFCVATDASALVRYITRFTEENFALLIAAIFMVNAIEKVITVGKEFPAHVSDCFCEAKMINQEIIETSAIFIPDNQTYSYNKYKCSFNSSQNGTLVNGWQSQGCHYIPNVFLATVLLFIGTFTITMGLKNFRTTNFFPTKIRSILADFAVIIAMITMTCVDVWLNVETPKLKVPATFSPTITERSWLVHPLGNNPWWSSLFAFVPALLATILVFMDQQITVVIVNRKEHLLKKGCGYHLDLLVVAVLIIVCSMFGMPWCEASTVPAINHVKSLTLESESRAPGEKPHFLGIREQRITHIVVFLLIGVSVLMAPMLTKIPMPVLFGLFLYMGVASLNGLQMFDRICLFFMPKKYQPDSTYLRRVPLSRVHLFTAIQVTSLIGLWIVKDIKNISILFPLMLVFMVGLRKLMDKIFYEHELRILDDILPSFKRHKQLDDEDKQSLHSQASVRVKRVTMANGNVINIPVADEVDSSSSNITSSGGILNITEEITRTSVWRSLPGNGKCKKRKKHHQHYPKEVKENNHKQTDDVNEKVDGNVNDTDDDEGGIRLKFASKTD